MTAAVWNMSFEATLILSLMALFVRRKCVSLDFYDVSFIVRAGLVRRYR